MALKSNASAPSKDALRDFTTDCRLLPLTMMALVVGTAGSAAAWLLLKLIALFTNLAYFEQFSFASTSPATAVPTLWIALIPAVGGLIIGLMARFGSEKIRGHGIPEAIEAILMGKSRIEFKVAILKPISAAIAIGTGGPFGAEGPIIMTGGALGSLFGQFFHLNSAERKTLLVAGAAAGMTSVFGTPIAAVLLAVELLLFEWKPRSFIPVAVAAIVAAAWRPWLLGTGPLFPYAEIVHVPWWGLGICVLVGIVAGLQSALMTVSLYGIEDLFRRLPIHWMWWPILGGIAVGIGGYIDPAVLGIGYGNIVALLQGSLGIHDAAFLLIGKAAVWVIALSSGTSGGVLAPLLIMGGALGSLEAHFLPFGGSAFWALIGMAAILGGTMRAPLTATLFAVELTGNLSIMPQVLIASVAAFAVTVLLMRRSILTERIARHGHHITREYAIDPFLHIRVDQIMVRQVQTLKTTLRLDKAIAFFTVTDGPLRHKSYPVVDEQDVVLRMVSRADILRWMREGWEEGSMLGDMQEDESLFIGYADEPLGHLANRMAAADVGRVPIVDRKTGRLVGLVARRDLLRARAHVVQDEQDRQRLLGPGSLPPYEV